MTEPQWATDQCSPISQKSQCMI